VLVEQATYYGELGTDIYMARIRSLSNPPIVEALMDFVFLDASIDEAGLNSVAHAIKGEGWDLQPIRTIEAEIGGSEIDEEGEPGFRVTSRAFEGFVVRRSDGHVIFQLRADRVTVSHVGSYRQWEDLQADAARIMEAHTSVSGATHIKRLAARFINRVRFPSQDPQAFLSMLSRPPTSPEGVSGSYIEDFLSRKVLKGLPDGITANVSIGTTAPESGDEIKTLVVDVDVFKSCNLPAKIDALSNDLLAIRDVKNRLFFGSLQESALEAYT
jgi:uncharacterized protein (TIGR04255 family)